MRLSPLLLCSLLMVCRALACAQPRTYIGCDKPITCSVSYGSEMVTVQLQTREACDVRVWTGFAPRWAFLNGQKAKEGWSCAEDGIVLVNAPAGNLLWEFGLGNWPLRGSGPPFAVKVDGKHRTLIRTTFWPRRMEARGEVKLPLALYAVTLIPAYPIPHPGPLPKLSLGGTDIAEWEEVLAPTGRQGLRAERDLLLEGDVGLHLVWEDTFTRSPMREVLLETKAAPTPMAKIDPPDLKPPDAIIVEAEDFRREGDGGPVEVSRGEHADQHGGASIFSFGPGPGHWVEWEFEAPEAGRYALYARTATQEEYALRSLTLDRKLPFPAAACLQFPGTGGWARDDANQWAWVALAGAEGRPPLELTAGEHRLRLTTIGGKHLNVDLLVLAPK